MTQRTSRKRRRAQATPKGKPAAVEKSVSLPEEVVEPQPEIEPTVAMEDAPIVQGSISAIAEPTPAVKDPTPAVEEIIPAIEEPTLSVDPTTAEPTSAVEETTPAVGETTPAVEEPTSAIEEPASAEADEDAGTTEQEREVWETFKEENYEVLEQLPLSLQRSFTLMLELDQQVHDYEARILPSLKKYIKLRKTLAGETETDGEQVQTTDEPAAVVGTPDIETVDAPQPESTPAPTPAPAPPNSSPRKRRTAPPSSTPGPSSRRSTTTASPIATRASGNVPRRKETPVTTRGLLTQIAQLSEEVVRAANEKVNVARFAYDLVDRYIRDLDRAIKEQETSISLGMRPGTHPASIILPDVVVPATRPVRVATSPSLDVEIEPAQEADVPEGGVLSLGIAPPEPATEVPAASPPKPRRRSKAKWSRKKSTSQKYVEPLQPLAEEAEEVEKLTLTVPPLASAALNAVDGIQVVDMPVDPNEPRYCYCNQVSFGVMIACDNPHCKLEWFHLGCCGLTQPPEAAKWYCRDCEPLMAPRRKTRQY